MKQISNEILKVTQDLIKIPSISSDQKFLNETIDYVKKYFHWLGSIYEYEFNWKKTILIQNFKGKNADILLSWHLDVVPAKKEQFVPKIVWDNLFGRWSLDMKSWVAIMMVLMKNLLKNWYKEKSVWLMLNTDEEVGWIDGALPMVSKKWYRADVVLIPDWWSINDIVYAEKWPLHLEVEANWISTHASKPWNWKNAVDILIWFYSDLKKNIEQKDLMKKSKSYWSSTVNLNIVEASSWATNIIPAKAIWKFDIRYTEKFSQKSLINLINKLAAKHWIQIIKLLPWDLLYTKPDNHFIKKYHYVAKSIIWKQVKLVKDHVASDGRFFGKVWSAVILHQPDWANLHGDGEFSKISNFQILYQVYEKFILN